MPLFDQDGREVDGPLEARISDRTLVTIDRLTVEHDRVRFFAGDDKKFEVNRPTHPGAGLELVIADSVDTDPDPAAAAEEYARDKTILHHHGLLNDDEPEAAP